MLNICEPHRRASLPPANRSLRDIRGPISRTRRWVLRAPSLFWHDEILEIWSHTQAIFALRDEIAEVLDLPIERVVARHAPGAGCYGHNGADDAALDAALLAAAVKDSPVRLQWMREDEFVWEPFGPAMMVEITGQLASSGEIAYWDEHIWGNRHIARRGG